MPTDPTDPFAAAGFAPAPAAAAPVDPFSAAGFAPVPQPPAKPSLPPVIGVTDFGAPIFADDAENAKVQSGEAGVAQKALEGATLGLAPYGEAAVKSVATGQPYGKSLSDVRNYSKKFGEEQPFASGLAEAIGGLPTAAVGGAIAGPLARAAAGITRFSPWLADLVTGAGLGGATAAGHDLGSGQTENIGSDTAKGAAIGGGLSAVAPVVGGALQSVPNMVRGGIAAGRTVFTGPGHDAVAGQILREAGGDFANTAANSPIPGLELRTTQATGNPGLASLERTLLSPSGMQTGNAADVVQNGRTPAQMSALARSLVGDNAGIEPSLLTNEASANGTQAITAARDALRNRENELWSAPALQNLRFPRDQFVTGVQGDIARMPPSMRLAINNSNLGGFIQDLAEGGENTSIPEVNAVRSRILSAVRDAKAAGDNVTGAAGQAMADSILNRTGAAAGQGGQPALDAYTAARDLTRQRALAFGSPEFDAILRPNAAGNMRANDETAFGRFFDPTGGTDTGLQKLQTVSNLLRQPFQGNAGNLITELMRGSPNLNAASNLDNAAQQYARAAVLRQARAGNGLDATGAPVTNPATLASTANKVAPALSAAPMTAPVAGDIQAAGNAAELLNRPSTLRGDSNSTTFEKLKNHDLVSAIVGQSGSSALGAAAGGYGGYEYGPEGVPWYVRTPAGALAGALLGQRVGPYLGRVVAHTPGISAVVTGPTEDITRRVLRGLASPAEYQRLIATTMPAGPALTAPGALSNALPVLTRGAIPALTSGGGQ